MAGNVQGETGGQLLGMEDFRLWVPPDDFVFPDSEELAARAEALRLSAEARMTDAGFPPTHIDLEALGLASVHPDELL